MLYKVILTFKSVDEILKCGNVRASRTLGNEMTASFSFLDLFSSLSCICTLAVFSFSALFFTRRSKFSKHFMGNRIESI